MRIKSFFVQNYWQNSHCLQQCQNFMLSRIDVFHTELYVWTSWLFTDTLVVVVVHGLLTLAVFMEMKQSMGEWEQSILPYISLGNNAAFSSMRSVFCWFSFPEKAIFASLMKKAHVNVH